MKWLRLIRWPNLIIVAFTMVLLHWILVLPSIESLNLSPLLTTTQFLLLVLMTLSATAAGYIVNDFFDYKIDIINKPKRVIINKSITRRSAKKVYLILVMLGAFIGSYLSGKTELWGILLLYYLVTILLFLYARYFKRQLLIGNLVVALLCALVPVLVWYVHQNVIVLLESNNSLSLNTIFLSYIGFSFFITLFRETVKDIEDLEGDQALGLRTLPIVSGLKTSKLVAGSYGVIVLLGILFLCTLVLEQNGVYVSLAVGLFLFLLLATSILLLAKAKNKK
ncbi:MAG: geranylgeranylglycerol-phosphate geranylgeranyltransferase, partial [Saprospiraceae bacterium]